MDVPAFLEQLKSVPWYRQQISHVETIPPRAANFGNLNDPLNPALQSILEGKDMWPLYVHQVEAIHGLRAGQNVVVATPAASGKSLCYHLPVIDTILSERSARALYIYPSKALAQDQLKSLKALGEWLPLQAAIFDGDTPGQVRAGIKRSTQILLTNPDMLHLGILPNHRTWSRLLRSLRYVVLDEVHIYRGVFGSHMANVVRRLRRLCAEYGSSPQFILCSATIANPGELAQQLTGLPFHVVDEDGAPYGGKRFAFWNPPLLDTNPGFGPAKGKSLAGPSAGVRFPGNLKPARRSANTEAANLMTELVSRNIRTLTFVRTRKVAELVYMYARDQLNELQPPLGNKVSPYRASYMADDRRAIEKALFDGELTGVAATNALELGIDVGTLDATVITGYPGSISSTWQQSGRSGRRGEESLSVFVARDNPLDQYFMNHPQIFFGRPVERALLAPDNPYIMQPHLLCAAYELPLSGHDTELFGPNLIEYLEELLEQGFLCYGQGRWHIASSVSYPAETVGIRSTSIHNYVVVHGDSGVIMETVEEASAMLQLHPGAVYLHRGESYLVKNLDLESRTATVEPNDGAYYTQARDVTDITVSKIRASKVTGGVGVWLGDVEVVNQAIGYKKRLPMTEEVVGDESLDLPPRRFNTVALWFDVPQGIVDRCRGARLDLAGGLHATEHAAIGVLPLFALCDRNDIGGVSTPLHPDTGKPQIFIYDGHPGGIGIAEQGFRMIDDLWEATLSVISECPCDSGCPSCIQSPKCGNNNHPLDKFVAKELLKALCGDG